jgi:hypothetical protein
VQVMHIGILAHFWSRDALGSEHVVFARSAHLELGVSPLHQYPVE